jgi:hypothetical protein
MLTSNRRSATRLRALFDAADIPKHHLRSLRAIDTFLEEI